MSAWTNWETVSHHVSICGRAVHMDGKPMCGVQIDVSESKQSQTQPRKRSDMPPGRTQTRRRAAHPDGLTPSGQTESRADGIFFFLDCPDGQYTVRAIDASSGAKAEKSITVADSARKKHAKDQAPAEGCWVELVLKQ